MLSLVGRRGVILSVLAVGITRNGNESGARNLGSRERRRESLMPDARSFGARRYLFTPSLGREGACIAHPYSTNSSMDPFHGVHTLGATSGARRGEMCNVMFLILEASGSRGRVARLAPLMVKVTDEAPTLKYT